MIPFWRSTGPVHVRVFGATHPGRVRNLNEDSFLVADLSPSSSPGPTGFEPIRVGDRGILLLVADGMGGAAAGEVASSMAADVVLTALNEGWVSGSAKGGRHFVGELTSAVERANDEIHSKSRSDPKLAGMGSTLTVGGVLGDHVYMLQVGDSRGYLVRGGSAQQLTRDQSLTQHLVDVGQISESDAENSERRNVILQALGPAPEVKVAVTSESLHRGDYLVLCSDGLSGLVGAPEIASEVTRVQDPAAIASNLIELANSRGGHDNITVVVAHLDGAGLRAP